MRRYAVAATCIMALGGCTASVRPQYVIRLKMEAGQMREASAAGLTAIGRPREEIRRVVRG
jgi:hypothetical protein